MAVPAAYATVVLIWSTTPLMVVWSNDSLPPLFAAAARMTLALVLGLVMLPLLKQRLQFHRAAWKAYFAASLGTFGAMALTYYAAQFVSSGLISIIFGLTPILTMLSALYLLNEPLPGLLGNTGIAISLSGLVALFAFNGDQQHSQMLGIILLVGAVSLFALSGVLVKKIDAGVAPLPITMGALIVSVPAYWVLVYINGSFVAPDQWTEKSQLGVLYLAIGGSLVGWLAYYYVLERISATAVSLVTLITPMIAVWLGIAFNGESLSYSQGMSSLAILAGLALFIAVGNKKTVAAG